jgi:hypothetical protein
MVRLLGRSTAVISIPFTMDEVPKGVPLIGAATRM